MSQSILPCASCEGREAGACGTCLFHRGPQDDDEMIFMWATLARRTPLPTPQEQDHDHAHG